MRDSAAAIGASVMPPDPFASRQSAVARVARISACGDISWPGSTSSAGRKTGALAGFDQIGERLQQREERFRLFVAVDDDQLRASGGAMQQHGVYRFGRQGKPGKAQCAGVRRAMLPSPRGPETQGPREAGKQIIDLQIAQSNTPKENIGHE